MCDLGFKGTALVLAGTPGQLRAFVAKGFLAAIAGRASKVPQIPSELPAEQPDSEFQLRADSAAADGLPPSTSRSAPAPPLPATPRHHPPAPPRASITKLAHRASAAICRPTTPARPTSPPPTVAGVTTAAAGPLYAPASTTGIGTRAARPQAVTPQPLPATRHARPGPRRQAGPAAQGNTQGNYEGNSPAVSPLVIERQRHPGSTSPPDRGLRSSLGRPAREDRGPWRT